MAAQGAVVAVDIVRRATRQVGKRSTGDPDTDAALLEMRDAVNRLVTSVSNAVTDTLTSKDGLSFLTVLSGIVAVSNAAIAIYNTPDQVNYERLLINWATNVLQMFTGANGSGVVRNLQIGSGATDYSEYGIVGPDHVVRHVANGAESQRITSSNVTAFVPNRTKVHTGYTGSENNISTGAVRTTDATQTTAWSLTLANNTLYWFEAFIVGRDEGGVDRAFFQRLVRVHRQGGGGATLGTVQTPVTDQNTAFAATFTVSSNDIRVSVTGLAGMNVSWTVTVLYQGVSTSA